MATIDLKSINSGPCLFLLAVSLFFLYGCGNKLARFHPDYGDYRQNIHRLLLMPPDIQVFEEMADETLFYRETDSNQAGVVVGKAVSDVLSEAFSVETTVASASLDADAAQVRTLFRNVNRSIQLHTYGPQLFPEKQNSFDYGLGPLDTLLEVHGAEALVLAAGYVTLSITRPKVWISLAVAEPGGTIIWYGALGADKKIDITLYDVAVSLVEQAAATFLEARP